MGHQGMSSADRSAEDRSAAGPSTAAPWSGARVVVVVVVVVVGGRMHPAELVLNVFDVDRWKPGAGDSS